MDIEFIKLHRRKLKNMIDGKVNRPFLYPSSYITISSITESSILYFIYKNTRNSKGIDRIYLSR